MPENATAPGSRPFVILLGLDLTDQEGSGFAFDQALRVASRVPGSEIHVLYVLAPATGAEEAERATGLLRLYLSEKTQAAGLASAQRGGMHVRRGDPGTEILQLASDIAADAIVVGAHRHPQLKHLFVGTTAERVMAAAPCPVFVAGPRPRPHPAAHEIAIEPPCPDCVVRRAETQGRSWWCARHSESHPRARHIYSYQAEIPFTLHDSEVTPTGVD